MKKLSDIVGKDVVKKLEYSQLKSKVVGFELRTSIISTLILNDQYDADKEHLGKKIEAVHKKILDAGNFIVTK